MTKSTLPEVDESINTPKINWDVDDYGIDLAFAWGGFVFLILVAIWLIVGSALFVPALIILVAVAITTYLILAWVASVYRVYMHWRKDRS